MVGRKIIDRKKFLQGLLILLLVAGGCALAPSEPGLGISWDRDAIDDRRVR